MAKRDQVLEAIGAIGRPCTEAEITKWLKQHRPGPVWTDVRNALSALSINDNNRRHNDPSRSDFTPDANNPKDALIRISVRGDRKVWYWMVDAGTGEPLPYDSDTDASWVQDVAGRLDYSARYWCVLRAVQALGRACTIAEIEGWVAAHEPKGHYVSARQDATMLTVNDGVRTQFDAGRRDYRSDRGHPKDVLFHQGEGSDGVTYELYDPAKHGIWDLRPSAEGKWVEVEVSLAPTQRALAEARAEVYASPLPTFDNETTARRFEMRAIALREGQPRFRAELLDAYDARCALSGCPVIAILEAAHIRPYALGGSATNRTDNGILLRADLHTLFDKGLLWIDTGYRVQTGPELEGSEYESFSGKPMRLPDDEELRPHPEHLAHHRVHTARQPT